MKKVTQRIEEFYMPGTAGAVDGIMTLESVICRVNSDGWSVDQIIPLCFRPTRYSTGSLDVSSGIVLCSKIE